MWLQKKLAGEATEGDFGLIKDHLEVYADLGADQLAATLADVTFDFENTAAQIAEEKERLAKWKAENDRRRHNYFPAMFELLKQLAKKNMLEDLYK